MLFRSAQRSAEGAALLARTVAREANILAYNDVFMLIGALAIVAIIWSYAIRWSIRARGEESPVILLQRAMQAQAEKTAAMANDGK